MAVLEFDCRKQYNMIVMLINWNDDTTDQTKKL